MSAASVSLAELDEQSQASAASVSLADLDEQSSAKPTQPLYEPVINPLGPGSVGSQKPQPSVDNQFPTEPGIPSDPDTAYPGIDRSKVPQDDPSTLLNAGPSLMLAGRQRLAARSSSGAAWPENPAATGPEYLAGPEAWASPPLEPEMPVQARKSIIPKADVDGHSYEGTHDLERDTSGGLGEFGQFHRGYGVDAGYDNATDLATGVTAANQRRSQALPPAPTPGVPPFAFDQSHVRFLTVAQIAGIVFNENSDVTPGESTPKQLLDAMTAQAHAVINQDRKYGKRRDILTRTASPHVSKRNMDSNQYQQALTAARTAFLEDAAGIDPTGGRVFFNNRFEHDNKDAPKKESEPRPRVRAGRVSQVRPILGRKRASVDDGL